MLSITQNIFFNDKFDLKNPPFSSHPRTYWFKLCNKKKSTEIIKRICWLWSWASLVWAAHFEGFQTWRASFGSCLMKLESLPIRGSSWFFHTLISLHPCWIPSAQISLSCFWPQPDLWPKVRKRKKAKRPWTSCCAIPTSISWNVFKKLFDSQFVKALVAEESNQQAHFLPLHYQSPAHHPNILLHFLLPLRNHLHLDYLQKNVFRQRWKFTKCVIHGMRQLVPLKASGSFSSRRNKSSIAEVLLKVSLFSSPYCSWNPQMSSSHFQSKQTYKYNYLDYILLVFVCSYLEIHFPPFA